MARGEAAAHAPAGGIVGRRDEVAALRAAMLEARAGRPAFIVVAGEAGIGKSRLVRHAAEQATVDGFDVHLGRCHEHVPLPYLALTSLLDRLAAVAAGSPALHTFAPVIDRLLGRGEAPDLTSARSSNEERALLFHATSQALLTLAAERPVLIALDDLHWVDTPTLDLVAHLVDALDTASLRHGARALIVATSRPEPGGPTAIALERLARTGIGRRIDVGGLDRGEVAELISTLGLQVPSRQAVDAVVRLTRGNPLAVEGVARQVRLGELTGLDRIGQLALPIELEDHATRCVAELPAPARTILTMAALLDRSVNTEELARLGSFDVAAVVEARDLGITHGVLAAAGDIVRFAHALFSRALVQSLPASTRQQFHAELAARLEEDPDSAVAEIAHHLLAAGPGVPAVTIHRVCEAAGEQAWTQVAWRDAHRDFAAAADAAEALGLPPDVRGHLWMKAARAATRDLDMREAAAHYDRSMPLLDEAGDLEAIAAVLAERALLDSQSGDIATNVEPLTAAIARLAPESAGNAGRALAQLADLLWVQGRIDESRRTAAQAIEVGERANDPDAIARAHVAIGMSHLVLLELEQAGAALELARTIAARGGDRWWATTIDSRLALQRLLSGRVGEADRLAADAANMSRAVGQLANEAVAEGVATGVAAVRGDIARVGDAAAAADRAGRLSNYVWSSGFAFPALATGRLLAGDYEGAIAAVDTWMERTGGANSLYRDLARLTRLVVTAHRGDRDALVRELEADERFWTRGWPVGLSIAQWGPGIVEVVSVGDAPGVPLKNARRQLDQLDAAGVVFTDGLMLYVPRLRGVMRGLDGEFDDAVAILDGALAKARAMGATAEVGRTALDLARVAASIGDDTRARENAAAALRVFDSIGATTWAVRARELAAQLGGEAPSRHDGAAIAMRRTAVIFFTDIVESTSLTESLGDAEFRGRTATLERCVRTAVREGGGDTMPGVRLGDGLLALFPLAAPALECARAAHACAAEVGLHLRIGLHAGTMLVADDTAHGASVNTAARVCSAAAPGHTAVTDDVRQLARDHGWSFEPLAVTALKGVSNPPAIFTVSDR